ncbi:MAG: GNAT family N-acetyltransferase [Bdellovibrionales bacterium]|nr:GNAT family N-acetyltransferase [Oligoflexia bacterium]
MSGSEVFSLRVTQPADIDAIIELCAAVYPGMYSWGPNQLGSQLEIFNEGQWVVLAKKVDSNEEPQLVGMASSVVIDYSRHNLRSKWSELTDWGYLGNHEPETGRTLYGVEIMVHPAYQGKGVGSLLYREREKLALKLGMDNIRAGARISGYHLYAPEMSAAEYLEKVVKGELNDPTLSFQLKRGFRVIGLTPRYFHDPESLHYAAVIEFKLPVDPR